MESPSTSIKGEILHLMPLHQTLGSLHRLRMVAGAGLDRACGTRRSSPEPGIGPRDGVGKLWKAPVLLGRCTFYGQKNWGKHYNHWELPMLPHCQIWLGIWQQSCKIHTVDLKNHLESSRNLEKGSAKWPLWVPSQFSCEDSITLQNSLGGSSPWPSSPRWRVWFLPGEVWFLVVFHDNWLFLHLSICSLSIFLCILIRKVYR